MDVEFFMFAYLYHFPGNCCCSGCQTVNLEDTKKGHFVKKQGCQLGEGGGN